MITPCLVAPDGEHWWIEPTALGSDRECLRCGADWTGDTDIEAIVGILRAKDATLSKLRSDHLNLQQEYRASLRNTRVLAQVHDFRAWLLEQSGALEPEKVLEALALFLVDPTEPT